MPTVSSQIPAGLPQAGRHSERNLGASGGASVGQTVGLAMERAFLDAFGAAMGGGLRNDRAERLVAAQGLGKAIDETAVRAADVEPDDADRDTRVEQDDSIDGSRAPDIVADVNGAASAVSERAATESPALKAEQQQRSGQQPGDAQNRAKSATEPGQAPREQTAQAAAHSGRASAAQVEQEALKSPSTIATANNKPASGDAVQGNAGPASNASGAQAGASATAGPVATTAATTASTQAASASARTGSARTGSVSGPSAAQPTAGVAPQGQQSPAFRLVRSESAMGSQRGAPAAGKEVAQQAARGLAAALRQKGGTVTLRLNPGGMQVNGASVTARLEASSAVARELLDAELPRLRSALEAKGLHVEKLTVVTAERSVFGSHAQDARHGWSQGGDRESEQRFGDATEGEPGREDGEGREPGGGAPGQRTPDGRTDADLIGVDERAAETSEDGEVANQGPGGAPGDIDDGGAELTQRLDAVV